MRLIASIAAISALLAIALFAGLASAQQPDPDQLLKSAIDAQQHGDYPTAIREYRKLLELRPNLVEAKVNLGAALVHVGDFDGAIAMYRSALPSVGQKNAVLLNLALAYYKKGDYAHAAEQFETLHTAQPNDVRIAILLGDTDVRLGKADNAVALLEPMESGNAQNLDFEYAYGSALIKAGKRRDGVARMEKVATAGHSADAYLLAGSTLLDLNEFEAARRDLDAALALDPKLPRVYTLAGMARDKTGDTKDAETAFREALKANPDDFDANLYLGAILYKRRDLDEAKPYLDRALRLDPKSSMARYEVAMFESTSGQYDAAAQDLEKLVKDDPTWLEPHEELATLYYKLHRPADGAKEREIVEKLAAEQQAKGPGTN
jgi:tetratricopeptide (TPR) repeat protein